MTTLYNNFEGGTSTTTVSTGNSGGVSGNAFDSVSVGATASLQFSSAQAAHGTLSMLVQNGASSSSAHADWTTSMGTQATIYWRAYCYMPGSAGSAWRMIQAETTGSHVGSVFISGTTIHLSYGSGFTSAGTLTTPVPTGQWFRLEGYFTGDSSAGAVSASLYTVTDSVTPAETKTFTGLNTGSPMNQYQFGQLANASSLGPFYLDDIAVSSTGPIGPFTYPYLGNMTLDYLDYVDLLTSQTLVAVPGGSYIMLAVNSRAGLTVPPPDNLWSRQGT